MVFKKINKRSQIQTQNPDKKLNQKKPHETTPTKKTNYKITHTHTQTQKSPKQSKTTTTKKFDKTPQIAEPVLLQNILS